VLKGRGRREGRARRLGAGCGRLGRLDRRRRVGRRRIGGLSRARRKLGRGRRRRRGRRRGVDRRGVSLILLVAERLVVRRLDLRGRCERRLGESWSRLVGLELGEVARLVDGLVRRVLGLEAARKRGAAAQRRRRHGDRLVVVHIVDVVARCAVRARRRARPLGAREERDGDVLRLRSLVRRRDVERRGRRLIVCELVCRDVVARAGRAGGGRRDARWAVEDDFLVLLGLVLLGHDGGVRLRRCDVVVVDADDRCVAGRGGKRRRRGRPRVVKVAVLVVRAVRVDEPGTDRARAGLRSDGAEQRRRVAGEEAVRLDLAARLGDRRKGEAVERALRLRRRLEPLWLVRRLLELVLAVLVDRLDVGRLEGRTSAARGRLGGHGCAGRLAVCALGRHAPAPRARQDLLGLDVRVEGEGAGADRRLVHLGREERAGRDGCGRGRERGGRGGSSLREGRGCAALGGRGGSRRRCGCWSW